MVQTALLAIALPCSKQQREVGGFVRVIRLVQVFQCNGNCFCEADAYKTTGRNRVATANQSHGLRRRNNLAGLQIVHRAVHPPAMGMDAPVMNAAPEEHRNTLRMRSMSAALAKPLSTTLASASANALPIPNSIPIVDPVTSAVVP